MVKIFLNVTGVFIIHGVGKGKRGMGIGTGGARDAVDIRIALLLFLVL